MLYWIGSLAALGMFMGMVQQGAHHIVRAGQEGSPSRARVVKLVLGTLGVAFGLLILFFVFVN